MSKTKGFFAGVAFGSFVAAAGYGYYKMLTVEQQADLKAKFDETVADVRDKVVDYSYAATDAVASVRDKADDFVSDKTYAFDTKVADFKESAEEKSADLRAKADELLASAQAKAEDLRSQAQDLTDQAKAKAQDLKDQVKGDDEGTTEDIILSATDDAVAAETFEDLETPVITPEVLEPTEGLSETDKKGLSEE